MFDVEETFEPDEWAVVKTKNTPRSREALRLKLARDIAIFEAKRGPTKTTEITSAAEAIKRIKRASGDQMPFKLNPDGQPGGSKLSPIQQQAIEAIRSGKNTVAAIANHCGVSKASMQFTLGRLVRNVYLERLKDGTYKAVDL